MRKYILRVSLTQILLITTTSIPKQAISHKKTNLSNQQQNINLPKIYFLMSACPFFFIELKLKTCYYFEVSYKLCAITE